MFKKVMTMVMAILAMSSVVATKVEAKAIDERAVACFAMCVTSSEATYYVDEQRKEIHFYGMEDGRWIEGTIHNDMTVTFTNVK